MGNRCNIVVSEKSVQGKTLKSVLKNSLVFYGHWCGSEMITRLQAALNKHERWDDPAYLARIIFCEFVGLNDFNGTTGYGISIGKIDDNDDNNPIIVVDVARQCVSFFNYANDGLSRKSEYGMSFNDFII